MHVSYMTYIHINKYNVLVEIFARLMNFMKIFVHQNSVEAYS